MGVANEKVLQKAFKSLRPGWFIHSLKNDIQEFEHMCI